MPTPPVSDEELIRTVEVRSRHKTAVAAAEELGINESSVRRRLRQAARMGLMGTSPVLDGFEISGIATIRDSGGRLIRETINQRPERGSEFQVPEGHSVRGVSALVGPDGRVIQQWMKTKAEPTPTDVVAEVRAALDGFDLRAPASDAEPSSEDTATVYPLADWHIGLLAWHRETGQNYDIDIASQTITDAMGDLVAQSPPSRQAVVLGLGDLLHSDGYEPMTSRSKNILDVDGRYPRVLRTAVRLIAHTVSMALAKHESVLLRILPGNHDDQSAIAVALALSCYYENEPRVTVDDDPGRFWWWSFGRVLLGATHGDQAKMKDLPLIMAARNPEAWGASRHRHIFTGHIHTQTGIEMSGVTVESFQTPAAQDAWHAGMGYGAGRSVSSITYHRERGEISRRKVTIG